jgi:hypothetical protein
VWPAPDLPGLLWQDEHDAETVRGGPNKELSLAQARRNVAQLRVSAAQHLDNVRYLDDAEHPLK